MTRLRRVSPRERGWTRRRAGKGFVYLDSGGERLRPEDVERIRALAIPPAWQDVWICPRANGHLQAVGTDVAGRRQYLYHPDWRTKRDAAKFERILRLAPRLPQVREQVLADLDQPGMPLRRACATAVRLLDLGLFRIGNDSYTDQNGSYGLTTLEKRHVRADGPTRRFRFVGKAGIEHEVLVDDPSVVAAVDTLRRRSGPASARLMVHRVGRRWQPLDSGAVNAYLREAMGDEFTAKDFRTWHATVLAAAALAASDEPGDTQASRRRALKAALNEVSDYLGNTPTMARSSYIDPAVIDHFESGVTLSPQALSERGSPDERQARLERATLRLLRQR